MVVRPPGSTAESRGVAVTVSAWACGDASIFTSPLARAGRGGSPALGLPCPSTRGSAPTRFTCSSISGTKASVTGTSSVMLGSRMENARASWMPTPRSVSTPSAGTNGDCTRILAVSPGR